MSKRVEHYNAPLQHWRTDPFQITRFDDGELGVMLHRCYDPANPYSDHAECGQTTMPRWFAIRKGFLLIRFALGLSRSNRHTVKLFDA